ncbi:protein translocase subunit SecD [Verrucomicrobiales bacterium]|nr:protein translocase subunit SecD [Verrucomicrobiales bacterium]
MTIQHLIFFVGLAMLGLFIWYFGTEKDSRKRVLGLVLTAVITLFCLYGIFNTDRFPNSYQVLFERADENVEDKSLDDELRSQARASLETSLKPEDKHHKLALSAVDNTISLSLKGLEKPEVDAAVAKVEEELNLNAEVTADPRPSTAIRKGIDLQGGSSFVVELTSSDEAKPITTSSLDQAIAVLETRLNPDGAKDLLTATQGENRILIQMPGVKPEEIDGIRKKIQEVAKLEFRLVHQNSASLLAQKSSPKATLLVPGFMELQSRPDIDGNKQPPVVVTKNVAISGDAVASASAVFGNDGWEILLRPTSDGAKLFSEVTTPNVGRQLAIIIDNEVLSAPVINGPLSNSISISGNYTVDEAVDLASNLENPLAVTPKIVDERSVSATYGENTIKQGIYAGIAGLALTLLFIILYYRIAGLIALVGLTVNIIILLGSLAMFDFTLTMPGIAGIVLTIGIAIDANVLIYERLREELSSGKTLGAAIQAAYEKAFSAIFDANLTTLITATILFMVASGQVKGFAVTLTIGILASLFAALLVTRVCFMWLAGHGGPVTKLKLSSFLPEGKVYDILGKRKPAFYFSLVAVIGAVAWLGIQQDKNLGVDFSGGELITFKATNGLNLENVSSSVADLEIDHFVQSSASPDGQDFITVRTEYSDVEGVNNAQTIVNAVAAGSGVALGDLDFSQDSVGPVVGKELAKSSALALLLGMLGIFVYLTFRFEVSFATGAITALVHDTIICLGIVTLLGEKLSLIHVGAFLTIAGYSINDTIVVFDRIRELLRTEKGSTLQLMNKAISQTLGRTILTSVTTLIVVICLAIFGGPSLRDFSVTLIVGVLIGTYSSLFVAAPMVLWLSRRSGKDLREEVLEADRAREIDDTGIEKERPGRKGYADDEVEEFPEDTTLPEPKS